MLGELGQLTMVGAVSFLAFITAYDYLKNNDKENDICKFQELQSIMGDGIVCSKHVRLSIDSSNEHILMIAPTGGGKSRCVMMPNVNHLKNCSIVCFDPSEEIESTCKTHMKVLIFNPFRLDSIGYDPLSNCKNEFEVRKLANVILTNGMNSYNSQNNNQSTQGDWISMATPLLSAYMLFNYHTHQYNFADVINNICTMPIDAEVERDKDGKVIRVLHSIEQEIIMSGVESAIKMFKSFNQVREAKQTLSSIRCVMNTCLQVFLDENVQKIFKKPHTDLSSIRKEESIVYIQIPERHAEYYRPLVATFLTQLFDTLLDNKTGLQIYCLFDEFSNCGNIPYINTLLGTLRKYHVSILAAILTLNSLNPIYGEDMAKTICELFTTYLVCGGLKDSGEYISNLLGTREEYSQTKTLMTPDEIRRLPKGEMIIICPYKRPVRDKMMNIVV